ncbi:MAG: CinA family protein [Candidatus Brocadiia bacterium]
MKKLISFLEKKGLTLSVAESCTGGLISHKITQVPGASKVFHEGIICYNNESKINRLRISPTTLKKYGAVSLQICRLMAKKVAGKSKIGLATTGIAGPSGATDTKPIGLVYVGVKLTGKVTVKKLILNGSRKKIKQQAADIALNILFDLVKCRYQ